jgi:hypothetical protein
MTEGLTTRAIITLDAAREPGQGDSALPNLCLTSAQEDAAVVTALVADVPDHLGPAFLRDRARFFQHAAEREPDPPRAGALRDLAATFEQHARTRECQQCLSPALVS